MKKNSPWVEKYRPTNFDDIVLEPLNKTLLTNIIETNNFPNLLFYGPPGTGKTTTIINLINAYQEKNGQKRKGLKIHLNASDDRGIDIIRNQIKSFVDTKTLFGKGIKFVILDEVDYMTKNAQQALKYLLQSSNYNVRFCLICNYISKIDESLKKEFICIRFNQLPKKDTSVFIKDICKNENLNMDDTQINKLLEVYNSDIRSMINFIQLNQNTLQNNDCILSNEVWDKLHKMIINRDNLNNIIIFIHENSLKYNIDKKTIIKKYMNYIIRLRPAYINNEFLVLCETILHINETNIQNILKFMVLKLQDIYSINK